MPMPPENNVRKPIAPLSSVLSTRYATSETVNTAMNTSAIIAIILFSFLLIPKV